MRRSIAAFGLVISACYTTGEGISPPLERIYFPVGLTTDCDPRFEPDCTPKYLYVASSDFDLQYNAGSIQGIRLDGVRELLERPVDCQGGECELGRNPNDEICELLKLERRALERQTTAERTLYPGPCKPIDLQEDPGDGTKEPLLRYKVGIGAFATDVILRYGPKLQKRLLVPVRGESSLHWIDLGSEGELECDQIGASGNCGHDHRVGTESTQNLREVTMPPEPYGIAASDAGDAIVVTHQTRGELSLFYQNLDENGWKDGPKLEYVHPLPAAGAIAVAAAPESLWVRNKRKEWLGQGAAAGPDPYPPGFLVAYRNAARVDLVRFFGDASSGPSRPFLQTVQSIPLRANAVGTDSRGIAHDDTVRRKQDNWCLENLVDETEREQCLKRAAAIPVGAYVTNRSPSSLLVGTADPVVTETSSDDGPELSDSPSKDVPQFEEVHPLPQGASRVYVGTVLNDRGEPETRLFVVCYDQRQIAIYDPLGRVVETYIRTGRGPHAMAFDFDSGETSGKAHALAYVGHFLDSYLGVIQLDRRAIRTYGTIVLSLAQPVALRATK